ncbi:thioredoxin [Epithele typhae]|uniref:thioredoxin n=1 Tax=Epithele typhae TaxID=378194 RepID=UPI0020085BF3|nr:thioredoxin [Epithele typhae]XP_047878530.1 thioredoxin [Epithele typhae]KAH9910780.1 thioredoxin [Epithele typhae]KAH9934071.1 thioredoxin [Epithele typhae]
MVQAVKDLQEFKDIINGDTVAIFDFWATWCGPCKIISPIFEKLAGQYGGAKFYKVDIDEAADIAEEVGVRAMPTFIAFKSGQKIKEVVGANPAGLQAMVESHATA